MQIKRPYCNSSDLEILVAAVNVIASPSTFLQLLCHVGSLGQQNTGVSLMSDVCSPLRKNNYQAKCALAFYGEIFFDNND